MEVDELKILNKGQGSLGNSSIHNLRKIEMNISREVSREQPGVQSRAAKNHRKKAL